MILLLDAHMKYYDWNDDFSFWEKAWFVILYVPYWFDSNNN